tara:strand:- start:32489 stop:33193 length:705 start_codon:yes stop_codon:yes gene_type:complete
MNGESTYKPNFNVVDDEPIQDPIIEPVNNKQLNENTKISESDLVLNTSEVSLIQKKRHKLRIFDPEGIYTFKHVEIGYFQSFLHAITMFTSLFLIVSFYRLIITDTQKLVYGLGYISDLNVLDKLCMTFIALYGLLKIKKTFTTKVTNFDKRYRLALCANALNSIVLNYLKLSFIFIAMALSIIEVEYPEITLSAAFNILENGLISDSLSIMTWFISIVLVVKAFKYCGKGEIK